MKVAEKEIDSAADEVARDDSKNETILDKGKLTRESKDIIDNLVDALSNIDLKSCRVSLFHIVCNTCIASTLELVCNRMYVAASQTYFLPCKPNDFNDLNMFLYEIIV